MSAKPMQGVFFSCGILLSASQADAAGTPISSWAPPVARPHEVIQFGC